MNKHLFRLGGIIITVEALFYAIMYIPQIFKSFSPGMGATFLLIAIIIGVILLLVSGIAAILHKRWSVITLWVSLAIALGVSLFLGYNVPSYFGNFQAWFTDFIIAVCLTIEHRKK